MVPTLCTIGFTGAVGVTGAIGDVLGATILLLGAIILLGSIMLPGAIIPSIGAMLMLVGIEDISPIKAAVKFACANIFAVGASGTKSMQTLLIQCRSPVGAGPSGNT